MKQNKKAFTLIELLVVVLIIGILAAIALPQYQMAVVKARVATMMPLAHSFRNAEEVYYLSNQTYTTDPTVLDMEIPGDCTVAGEQIRHYKCGDYFLVDFSDDPYGIYVNYCPGYNTDWDTCAAKRDFVFVFGYQHTNYAGNIRCYRQNDSALGKRICTNFTF